MGNAPPSASNTGARVATPPILRLAVVEQQLIMHCLDAAEIIRLARSSSQLLKSAQSAFAFKHTSTRLKSTARSLPPRRDTSLMRFSSLHFTLLGESHVANLASIVVGMPLRSLDLVSARSWTTSRWSQLCALSFPNLTSLSFNACPIFNGAWVRDLPWALFGQLLSHAPKLQSLDVRANSAFSTTQNDRDLWRVIAQFPIPRISLADTHEKRARSHLPHLASLPSLQRLIIRSPSLYGSDFNTVLSKLTRLLSLELHFLHCAGRDSSGAAEILDSDYAAAFKALRSLQQLRLFSCYKTHALIPHVVHAPALQMFEVDGDWMQSTAAVEMPLLSVAFANLLTDTRGLHCTLIFRCNSPEQARSDPLLRLCDPKHSARLSNFRDRFDFVVAGPIQTAVL